MFPVAAWLSACSRGSTWTRPWFSGTHSTNRVFLFHPHPRIFKGSIVCWEGCWKGTCGQPLSQHWSRGGRGRGVLGAVPQPVLLHAGFIRALAQERIRTAEETFLLLSTLDHNHRKGLETGWSRGSPCPRHRKAQEPGVCSQQEPRTPTIRFHTTWKMPPLSISPVLPLPSPGNRGTSKPRRNRQPVH